MAFTRKSFPTINGTSGHSSALKGKFAQLGAATPNEEEVESAMKSHKTGHAEMDTNKWKRESSGLQGEGKDQNKIYDKRGLHVGDWVVNEKGEEVKKMHKKGISIDDFDETVAKTK